MALAVSPLLDGPRRDVELASLGSAVLIALGSDMNSAQLTQDPALERLLVRIVEVMQPLEVWLFGSRAEGRHREDSDYDVLVVLPDSVPDAALDPVAAWRVARDARVAADIVPCRYSEFQDERDEIDTLARAATHRGRKLFER